MHGPGPQAHSWRLASRTVSQCTSAEVTAAIVHCFQNYLVPMQFTPEKYEIRFRGEDLDPFASRVYHSEGMPAAVVMIARRGWTSRLAAMAVAPDFRGRGLGKAVMQVVLEEGARRKDRTMLLEVFEQNQAAVSLYTGLGFRPIRRLFGYDFHPDGKRDPGSDLDRLHEIDPLIAARFIAKDGDPDLPWMLMPETFAAATLPVRAFHLDDIAFAIISDSDAEKILIRALLVRKAYRRQGWGSRILRALGALFADRPLAIQESRTRKYGARSFPSSWMATANAQPVRNENRVLAGSQRIGVILFPQRNPNPHTGFNSSKTRSTSSSVL